MLTFDELVLALNMIFFFANLIMTIISSKSAKISRDKATEVSRKSINAQLILTVQDAIDAAREALVRNDQFETREIEEAKRICHQSGNTLKNESKFIVIDGDSIEKLGEQLLHISSSFDRVEIDRFLFGSAIVKKKLLDFSSELVLQN